MNIALQRHRQSGSILLGTLCAGIVVVVALISFLGISTHQQRVAARSQVWNTCMPIAEAGVEEALTHCYVNFTNLAIAGWTYSATAKNYFKTNSLKDGYYHVSFTEMTPRIINSTGYMRLPGTKGHLSRALRVVNNQVVIFKKAINVQGGVDMNGNNVQTDSYDSRSSAKSTGQKYDPLKAGDKGDIVCSNIVNVGNADIWGAVITPPAAGLNIGPNGSVGSVAWHKAGNLNLEPGWWQVTTNIERYPAIKAPFSSGISPKSGLFGGVYYDHIFDTGNYTVWGMSGRMLVKGDAVVYSSGSVGAHVVLQNNSSLKLYVRGSSCEFFSVANANNYAGSCVVYGLPTCTSFRVSGSANLTCAVYAPQANMVLTGGSQVSGAVVCKDFTMTGHSQFHFDEALAADRDHMIFEIQDWDEL